MKIRYVVHCPRHGVESKDWDGKQVVVSKPKGKNDQKNGGCPYCLKEKREAEKESLP